MNRVTTLVLLLVVAGLGFAVWYKGRIDAAAPQLIEPLFEGVDARRIRALRIDDVERSVHLKLEREGALWRITDPIDYPAAPEAMRTLLEPITRNFVVAVPEEERAAAAREFDPPRRLLEVIELLEDGRERRSKLEIGGLDIDGMQVYVRIRDRTWRTMRNVDTAVKRDVDEFRSRRLFDLDPEQIVELHREGFEYTPSGQRPLRLDAYRRGLGWRMEHPWRVQADPVATSMLAGLFSTAKVRSFARDFPGPLEPFGLDHPHFTVELMDRAGEVQKVLVAEKAGSWFAKREGWDHVFEVEPFEVGKLTEDATQLFDLQLTRVLREAIDHVLLVGPGGEVRLTQDKLGRTWTVAGREAGPGTAGEWSVELPADPERVEGVLSTLEREQIARYLLDAAPEDHFPEEAPRHGFWVDFRGERQGGRVGELVRSDEGSEARAFLRDGDQLVALVPLDVGALLELRVEDLMSLRLFDVDEVDLTHMTLSLEEEGGPRTRRFQRSQEGRWRYVDMDATARELIPVLDPLIFLKASEHLPGAGHAPLQEVLTVELRERTGTSHLARIGRTPSGRVEAEILGLRSVLADQALHAALLEIVRRKPDGE